MLGASSLLRPPEMGQTFSGRPIRVSALVDAEGIRGWSAAALRQVAACPWVDWRGVVVLPEQAAPHVAIRLSPPVAAFDRWSRSKTPELAVTSWDQAPGPIHRWSAADWRRETAALDLDLLVEISGVPRQGSTDGLASHGVWSIYPGDPARGMRAPLYFHELARQEPVNAFCLMAHSGRFDQGRLIHRQHGTPTASLVASRNAAAALSMAGPALARRLFQVATGGWDWIERLPEWQEGEYHLTSSVATPTALDLASFSARSVAQSLRMNWTHSRNAGRWFIGARPRQQDGPDDYAAFDPSGFREVDFGTGLGYADPFVFPCQDKTFLFIEEIPPSERGRLVVCEHLGQARFSPPELILEADHHFSYPLVFEHGGEHWLIPETEQISQVRLYRARRFPGEWELAEVLAEGPLLDTTPWQEDGVWYFFVCAMTPGQTGQEGLLYYADRLGAPWQPHPASPISFDARNARPAGRLFRHRGRLVRPVQDCSVRYGYGVEFREVTRLTPTEFADRPLGRLDRTWHPRSWRAHTYNAGGGVETIDGWRFYRKSQRRPDHATE